MSARRSADRGRDRRPARRQRRGAARHRRAADAALRLPPSRARADRDARRLRAGRLRRLHGASRRGARPVVPPVRRPGRGGAHRDGRGARDAATSCTRCSRPTTSSTAFSAATARRVSLLATVALLERNPDPSEAEIRELPRGQRLPLHGLRRHRRPVQEAARQLAGGRSRWRRPKRSRTSASAHPAGSRTARFLRGRGKYVDDIQLPGTLHAAFLRSPHRARARRLAWTPTPRGRSTASRSCSPRRTSTEIPAIVTGLPREEVVANNRPVLPAETVRFVGEPSPASSRHPATSPRTRSQLIDVEYEPLPVVMDAEQALAEDAPLLHDGHRVEQLRAHRVRARRRRWGVRGGRPRLHEAIPPRPLPRRAARGARALLADWDAGTQEMTFWTSTQIPHLLRTLLCHAIGLTEKQLRVISPDVGGAFGLKLHLWPEDYLVAVASKRLSRPGEVDRGPLRGARGEPPREGDRLRARDRDEGRTARSSP